MLHAEFCEPSIRGYYLLFAGIDATSIPRNDYMQHRFNGDAFIFRINEQFCQHEIKKGRIRDVVYEHVPGALLRSEMLKEMMNPTEWKVLPNGGNVVKLGFHRMMQQQRREYLEQ